MPGTGTETEAETQGAERALALADEAFGRLDVDAVVAHLSTAIRGFTAADDPCRAAMACARLGDTLANAMGNLTAARAWFARARRLIDDQPPCLEQGWVAVAAMGCEVDDPAELLAAAELALARARRFGDVNLETKALADAGLAHVQAGRVTEGMALLDEAMALACGPADDSGTAAKSVCSFFTACYHATDFERAETWSDLLRRHGLIGLDRGGPVFLSSHCDSVQATLLVELGRWGEAEALLTRAKADFEAVMPVPAWHPDIALADLRIRQGRFAEAEQLLLGKDQSLQALLPAARLHLARGDHDLARASARRGLRCVGDDRLRAVELLTVLVDAELARGDGDAATRAADELARRTEGLDIPALQGRSAAARARARAAAGDRDGAVTLVEQAVDRLDPRQLPWLRATLLIELARLREEAGDPVAATVDARAATAALRSLDVVLDPVATALLDRLAQRHHRPGAPGPPPSATSAAPGSGPSATPAAAGSRPSATSAAAGSTTSIDAADPPPSRTPAGAGPTPSAGRTVARPTTPVERAAAVSGEAVAEGGARIATLARDPGGKWWVASCDGSHARLQDSKGLRYLVELLARPGVERHALDLVDRIEGVAPARLPGGTPGAGDRGGGDPATEVDPAGGVDRRALGDAGELLDARARTAYRHRIEELRAEVDEALAAGRLDAAEAVQGELDQLVAQLAQAFGLGGRSRRAASAAERARLNVTRALRTAIARLADALPATGDVLDRRVRTGLYCAYEPTADDPVRWMAPPS